MDFYINKTHSRVLRLIFAFMVGGWGAYSDAEPAQSAITQNVQLKKLTLQDAEALFLQNSREIRSARQLVDIAGANIKIADHAPNPVLTLGTLNVDLNRSKANTNYAIQNNQNGFMNQTYDAYVMYAQLWERGDKRALRKTVAENALSASQLDLQDIFRQQYLSLKNAYYDLKLAQEILLVQQQSVALYEDTLKATELRVKAGDATVSDLSRIQVEVMRTNNDLRLAEANVQKAQASFSYLIGKEAESETIYVAGNWPGYDADIQPMVDIAFIGQRPDVVAAETRINQSSESKKLAESLKYRDLTITGRYDHFPGQQTGMFTNTIGVQVDIPLFTNYQYDGEIARAEATYQNALTVKAQTLAMAMVELKQARANLLASTERSKRFDQDILVKAEKNASYAEFAYKHGATTVIDLLDAKRVMKTLQIEALAVKADYAKALSAWQSAIFKSNVISAESNQPNSLE